jgi:hypothetical protein
LTALIFSISSLYVAILIKFTTEKLKILKYLAVILAINFSFLYLFEGNIYYYLINKIIPNIGKRLIYIISDNHTLIEKKYFS